MDWLQLLTREASLWPYLSFRGKAFCLSHYFFVHSFHQQVRSTDFGLRMSRGDIFLRGTSISLFGNKRKSYVHTLDRILNLDNYCYHSIYRRRSSMYSLKQMRHDS